MECTSNEHIYFNKVFIKVNDQEDKLSREALLLQEGTLVIAGRNDSGTLTEEISFIF